MSILKDGMRVFASKDAEIVEALSKLEAVHYIEEIH